jgi:hypothetical protein
MKVMARIERDGRSWSALLLGDGLADDRGRSDAKSVIGNSEGVRGTKLRSQLCVKFLVHCFRKSELRLTVDAKHLLPDGVSPASEDARLGRCRPTFHAKHTRDVDPLVSEVLDKSFAGKIIADRADGQDSCAESREIVGRVGAAAGSEMRFAMAENQDRRFARNTRNFAELIFISDKIAEEDDGFRRELLDVVR